MSAARCSQDVLQSLTKDFDPEEILNLEEAIQRLSPELREIICKEFAAIKQRERAALGWNKVHEEILKLPFCKYRKQIVSMIICIDNLNGGFEGCCYPCLIDVKSRPRLHEVRMNPPINTRFILEMIRDYKKRNFIKSCSDDLRETLKAQQKPSLIQQYGPWI